MLLLHQMTYMHSQCKFSYKHMFSSEILQFVIKNMLFCFVTNHSLSIFLVS